MVDGEAPGGDGDARGGVPLRVLVVDDDEAFRVLLRIQLDLVADLEVVGTAADGVQALAAIEACAPDVVVTDLFMPVLDGFATIDRLRAQHSDVGVVAYTAVGGRYARDRVAAQGVELVLKSGDATELVTALRRSAAGRTGNLDARPS